MNRFGSIHSMLLLGVLAGVTAWGMAAMLMLKVDDGSSGLSLPILITKSFLFTGAMAWKVVRWLLIGQPVLTNADIPLLAAVSWLLNVATLFLLTLLVVRLGQRMPLREQ